MVIACIEQRWEAMETNLSVHRADTGCGRQYCSVMKVPSGTIAGANTRTVWSRVWLVPRRVPGSYGRICLDYQPDGRSLGFIPDLCRFSDFSDGVG